MKMLEVNELKKTYQDFSMEHISFSVDQGKIAGFIGVNGSGKTTTIRMLLNLIKSEAGSIKFFGEDYKKNEKEIKNRIGVVMDEGYFFDKLTMDEMKKIIAPAYSNWREDLYRGYMEKFELNPKQKIGSLSKGMKMKYALALAMSHEAELLIMDEPSSGLDPLIRTQLDDIMLDYVKDGKRSVFFSTHITSDLDKIADDIIFINKGKMIFQKSKEQILQENKKPGGENPTIEDVMIGYLEGKKI